MNEANPRALFVFRTTAKRNHTKLIKRARVLSNRNATHEEFRDLRTKLAQVHSRLVGIHQRYVQLADLDDAETRNAELYLQAINNQQLTCLNFIAFAIANKPSRRQTWEVSNHENATRNRTEPIQQNRTEETPVLPLGSTLPVRVNPQETQQQNNTKLPEPPIEQHTEANNIEENVDCEARDQDFSVAVKKRRIDLEFKLKQQQLQKDRETKDLELKYAREKEDVLLEMQQLQRHSELTGGPMFERGPPLTSTPIRHVSITPNNITPVVYAEQNQLASSRSWPKLIVAKFDGDPRTWTKFAHGINATLRDTNMPESLKSLALQDSLKNEIQKRVAHIFTSSHSFQSAWAVLENKYGSPGLIIQAHNQHLQQLPPFKHNDFNGLFNMAVAVRDAVSSVSQEHIVMFTSVVTSLCAKLPIHLQSDWGKLAYGLNRFPTLQDFDK